jgi:hypothetical protein
MLAKKRTLTLNGEEVARTPLLVPSFSSKGFPEVIKIMETTKEVIEGAILVSAYDLHYEKVVPPFDYASLLFLDSGGYEASKDADLSEVPGYEHIAKPWTQTMHESVLGDWNPTIPSVIISYDHPKEKISIPEQIKRAKEMAPNRPNFLREILLKPESETSTLLKIESVIPHVHSLKGFDVIGVTEKEIGTSIFQRMENIARLRLTLDKVALNIPIHVFGSLDTITTPLYFLAGADIFDGLTWLRFAYHDGYTIYKHNYGAIQLGLKTKAHVIDGKCWYDNYRYLVDLELEMRRFLNDYSFGSFGHHAELFERAYENVLEAVRT